MEGKVDVLVGLQWGDEGKGKFIDVLTENYDIITRFQGGPNAGHTIEIGENKYVLRAIPSGVFKQNKLNIIGNGTVIDLEQLIQEITELQKDIPNVLDSLILSTKASLILPTHKLLDEIIEESKSNKIGTTGKGIGPCYTDKISRSGLHVYDIFAKDFPQKYNELINYHTRLMRSYNPHLDMVTYKSKLDALTITFLKAVDYITCGNIKVADTEYMVNAALKQEASVLAEGAQGSLLDINFGTYPFVTSSTTVSGGVCSGLGIAPNKIGDVYGVFKAYCTRVGEGPFMTELLDRDGNILQAIGNEYGSVTGRPRRCGWLDLVALKYTCMLNGVTKLIMTKADVLSSFKKFKVCTEYKNTETGETTMLIPTFDKDKYIPVYKEFKGWKTSLDDITDYFELPDSLKDYIVFIEYYLNIPIVMVSVGPEREQTIYKK